VGIGELKRYFQWRLDALFVEERYKHLVLSPLTLSVEGGVARVDSYFAAFSRDGDRPILRVYGRYQDTLVGRAGAWRIRERLSWQETPAAHPRAPGEAGNDPQPAGAPPSAGGPPPRPPPPPPPARRPRAPDAPTR